MNDNERTTAVGVFEDRRHAHIAVEELIRTGFALEQIGFVMPDERPVVDPPQLRHHTRAEEGATAGVASGGVLGSLLGAALVTAVIPGVGPVLIGGLLAGAITGMAGGGLLGTLLGMSVPEEEARAYEKGFHGGGTVVTVQAGDRYDEAVAILGRAAEAPEVTDLHPGARASRLSDTSGPGPGSGSVFPGE